MTLTETLKQQHLAVVELVKLIQGAVERDDRALIETDLKQLKTALLAHLALEDAELYPGLERLGVESGSVNLTLVARQFASNMSRITEALLSFLDKYDGPILDLVGFKQDWSKIVSVLSARIASEEASLYPLYEKALKAARRTASRAGQ